MFGKAWLAFFSLLASVFLWVNFGKNEPVNQRQMDVPIELINQPASLLAVGLSPKVKVVANGTNRELDSLDPDSMHAQIDLSNAEAGTKVYELKLLNADKLPASVSLTRDLLRVTLERRSTITKDVEVETVGKRPENFRYAGATVQPPRVSLTGPESEVSRVAKVRVLLDLSGIKSNVQKEAEVEVLTESNRRLPNVVSDPATVTILPTVSAAPTTTTVLISPKWKGQPAFGFEVKSYQITPNQVQLTGSNSAMAMVTSLATEPIDLSGLKTSISKSVRLKLPSGVRIVGPSEVTVDVVIVASSPAEAPPEP